MDEAAVPGMTAVIEQLRPAGKLWTPRATGPLREIREAFAVMQIEFRDAVAVLLEKEADPYQTSALLPEWERWLGLPEPGLPVDPPPTTSERRAAIVAKLRAIGGQSPFYFVDLAAQMGYVIEIEEFDRSKIGCKIDTPIREEEWEFTWCVHAPAATIHHAKVGLAVAGDPIGTVGNELLEVFVNKFKPAHTVVFFAYDLP